MQGYKHLTIEERVKIEDYLEQGLSQAKIAFKLGRSRSTISREIKRNIPEHNPSGLSNFRYIGSSANNTARLRRMNIGLTTKLTDKNKALIEEHLRRKWSPEQIAHGLKSKVKVCTNTIYNWIYSKRLSFSIKDLRLHGRRYKKHHKGRLLSRLESKMMRMHSIEKRPTKVDRLREFGHWEVDTILSSRASNYCLATFVERKTRLYHAIKIKSRTASQFAVAMDTFMATFPGCIKSITCNHGSEFISGVFIGQLEQQFGIQVYFAHAYSPHERGCNEHHNHLIREYFPKKTNFKNISAKRILNAVYEINERPRKVLKWKNANYKFEREFKKLC